MTLGYAGLSLAELHAALRELLEEGLYGLCFGAYLPGQSPRDHSIITESQVRDRLRIIAPHTSWIRTFSCTEGNEHIPRIARELGLKTLVGAWIDGDRERNEAEINSLIEVAKAGHADLVAVGNEVLLRGELSEDELIGYLNRVREAVGDVPVGYVDAYYLFEQHPRLVDASDFLPINCYPFWEKAPLEHALAQVAEMVRRVEAMAGDKPVLVAETGWPTAGPSEGAAVPGPENAARYALGLVNWSRAKGIPLFWFSAFDEAWKVGAEGDAGAYWGLWDADGRLKLE